MDVDMDGKFHIHGKPGWWWVGRNNFFPAICKFFGQRPAATNETNAGIQSVFWEIKCPGFYFIIGGMSRAKLFWMKLKSIIYVVTGFSSLIACYLARLGEQIFSGALELFFGQRLPTWKIGPTPRYPRDTDVDAHVHVCTCIILTIYLSSHLYTGKCAVLLTSPVDLRISRAPYRSDWLVLNR